MGKLIDLTNQRFGSLVVISRGENNNQGKPQWNCICDCGEEYLVDGCRLRSGKATKCKKCAIKMRSINKYQKIYDELKNKNFNYLEIIEKKEDSGGAGHAVQWKCKCKCGNITYISTTDLLNDGEDRTCGSTSCPYLKAKVSNTKTENLIGNQYGELKVIEKAENPNKTSSNRTSYWKCQCSCGKEVILSRTSLIKGQRISCDNCTKGLSTGELIIQNILEENKINFKKQVTFSDLKGVGGGTCKFDFGIFDNNNNLLKLIEYDGEFHYIEVDYLNSKTVKENDIIKNEYCKKNNILLTRIPYWEKNNITLNLLMEGLNEDKGNTM